MDGDGPFPSLCLAQRLHKILKVSWLVLRYSCSSVAEFRGWCSVFFFVVCFLSRTPSMFVLLFGRRGRSRRGFLIRTTLFKQTSMGFVRPVGAGVILYSHTTFYCGHHVHQGRKWPTSATIPTCFWCSCPRRHTAEVVLLQSETQPQLSDVTFCVMTHQINQSSYIDIELLISPSQLAFMPPASRGKKTNPIVNSKRMPS